MLVVDLFSGLGGFSAAFAKQGHDVYRVDWDHTLETDLCRDIRTLDPQVLPHNPDWVLASPPCDRFSVASMGHHWNGPTTLFTERAIENVTHTVEIIEALQPRWWLIENPMGKLRKLGLIPYERHYTTLCRYGAGRMKPTDFWGHVPPGFRFRDPCMRGDWCHPSATRGSHDGTQDLGLSKAERAKLPYALSLGLLRASRAAL